MRIGDKTFMNMQEAVQWLLENNALPFQSTANYIGNTEISLGTIINPSPAKVRVGSLIFFADSKVSTVIGVTSNSFIVSEQYNNLVDDVVFVSNVAINDSGHLIVTLSNGDNIDAGLIKQISSFSIDASQHLIASYNDGTSSDLGAIFSGNITVSGNLSVTGGISGNAITGNSIIENMSGYSFTKASDTAQNTFSYIYAGAVKNGNKLTLVIAFNVTKLSSASSVQCGDFTVPNSVFTKLYPVTIAGNGYLVREVAQASNQGDLSYHEVPFSCYKQGANGIRFTFNNNNIPTNATAYVRIETTFLLSENLAS